MYFAKKIFFLIVALIALHFPHQVMAEAIITPLKDDGNFLQLLKKYGIHQEVCDKYIDRYTIVKNIEYYDFNGQLLRDGTIVVHDALAENVVKIFDELKQIKFPVATLDPIIGTKLVNVLPFGLFGWQKYTDNDDIDNLTGSYCCRNTESTNRLSLHAFGTAIDINTLQNPCIFIDINNNEIQNIVPKKGVKYLNRSFNRKGKLDKDIGKIDDKIVKIFKKYGYDVWGGYWDSPIDYQHFQVANYKFAHLLMIANKQDSKEIFNLHTKCVNLLDKSLIEIADEKKFNLTEQYKKNSEEFFKEIKNWCVVKSIKHGKNEKNKLLIKNRHFKTSQQQIKRNNGY